MQQHSILSSFRAVTDGSTTLRRHSQLPPSSNAPTTLHQRHPPHAASRPLPSNGSKAEVRAAALA